MNFLRGGTVLKVLKMGHPVLRQKATPYTLAEIKSPETKTLVQNMIATLRDQKGLGLAAPQVGISKQLLILELNSTTSDIDSIPLTIAFNPKLEFPLKHDTVQMWESCFSVPGYVGRIQRFANTIMDYTDEEGNPKRLAATGYLSGALQHEADHLTGTLFVDRLKNMLELAEETEWEKLFDDQPGCQEGRVKFYDRK